MTETEALNHIANAAVAPDADLMSVILEFQSIAEKALGDRLVGPGTTMRRVSGDRE